MPETFLILFAGGILLAAAIEDPRQVTLHWLRLAGLIALTLSCVSLFFLLSRYYTAKADVDLRHAQFAAFWGVMLLTVAQLGFVQSQWMRTQRFFAGAAFVCATIAGVLALSERSGTLHFTIVAPIACAGIAAMTGLALMDM